MNRRKHILRDEDGVTTISMAVCIFLSLALIFSAGQLYKVSSASSEVQEVADAAALAAENEVAQFSVAEQTCDATVLTMTLLAGVTYGIGVVAACIPPASGLSEKLIELGTKVVNARDKFAESAAKGLNALQKVLPFLAAANAAHVARANNSGVMDANYCAAALLVPQQGEPIGNICDDGLARAGQAIEDNAEDLRREAAEAEEAAKQANESKHEAFMHDCGNNPSYCMYERARNLIGLSGGANPLYASEDAWSFSVALKRAKAYYTKRAQTESVSGATVEEKADAALRKIFYEYARDLLNSEGYVNDNGIDFSCNFPKLFHNKEEFRETTLYTKAIFPVTESGGRVMHAWSGCPNAASAAYLGSVAQLEAGGFGVCSLCEFEVTSMSSVAAISTSANNGFEHHYAAVADAANKYSEAMNTLAPKKQAVQNRANGLLEGLANVLKLIGGQRIDAHPPGEDGAIALVVNTAQNSADTGFESLFVSGDQTLDTRAAVSGARLAADKVSDDGTVITSLLEEFGGSAGGAVGAARVVLDGWSLLLKAYQDGQNALNDAVRSGLNSFSQNTASGLGTWAANAFSKTIESCGLQPADLSIKKPILVNTGRVAENDSGAISVRYMQVKQSAMATSSPSTDLFSGVVDGIEQAIDSTGITDGKITIATIEFPVGDISMPITLTLPQTVTDGANGFVDSCLGALRSATAALTGARSWQ